MGHLLINTLKHGTLINKHPVHYEQTKRLGLDLTSAWYFLMIMYIFLEITDSISIKEVEEVKDSSESTNENQAPGSMTNHRPGN